jgi:AcrR family transcriptional regulator
MRHYKDLNKRRTVAEQMSTKTMKKINRKQQIIDAALLLFSDRGFQGTSTSLIAKEAGVSEALIFKYFSNKNKLLVYLIKNGYEKAVEYSRGMLQEKDPLLFIHKTIDLPSHFVKNDPLFWKLQKRLLVELDFAQKQHERFILPVQGLLKTVFAQLGYSEPEKETEVILILVDSLWKMQVNKQTKAIGEITAFIKTKYSKKK